LARFFVDAAVSKAPYDQLFIYEVAGDARPAIGAPPAGYLGLWLEADSSFVFFDRPADEAMARILAAGPGLKLLDRHQLSYEQWQGGQALAPIVVDDLHIVPAWLDYDPPAGARLVRLDPGLVFGSGLHPTTAHCLELLHLRRQRGPLGRVLDLGCGTGILGLAAAAWGAHGVTAVDLNPLCVETTQANARRNGLALTAVEGPAQDFIHLPAQVVLSNLHWQVQELILADEAKLAHGPELILSGIMRGFVGQVEDRLGRLGYRVLQRREADFTWFTFWAAR